MTAPPNPPSRAAIHESGHALLASLLAKDPLREPLTVVAMGSGAGFDVGWTAYAHSGDRFINLVVGMGGGAALEVDQDDDPWRGADEDLANARKYAEAMDAGQVPLLLTSAKEQARTILRERHEPLLALARALQGNGGRLGGPEVAAAVDWALRGRVWSREAAFEAMVADRNEMLRRAAEQQAREERNAENVARIEELRAELFEAALDRYQESHFAEPDDSERAEMFHVAEERALITVCPLPE